MNLKKYCLALLLVTLISVSSAKFKLLAFKGPRHGFIGIKYRKPKLFGFKKHGLGHGLGFGHGLGHGLGFGHGLGGFGHGGFGGFHGGGYSHHQFHESHFGGGGFGGWLGR